MKNLMHIGDIEKTVFRLVKFDQRDHLEDFMNERIEWCQARTHKI